MAYKIQYSPECNAHYPNVTVHRKTKWKAIVIPAMILAGILWVRLYGVPDVLIPGNPEVTRSAASGLLTNIGEGIAMKDAITVFCKEIIHGAQI